MNSGTVVDGTERFATMTSCTRVMLATGAMSRLRLKLSFSYIVVLIAFAVVSRKERVAIGRRAHDRLGGDIAASTRPVLDDEWPAEPFRQPLAHQTCDDVESASCGGTDDQTHRPHRIGLCPRDARDCRERGSAGGQMEESTARQVHGV